MTPYKPAIVVVAFNRPRSLQRLLKSLQNAFYPSNDIQLVLSIDRGKDNEDVVAIANNFSWEFGTKNVVYQEENLGLRKHVLKCGDLTNEYDSIIMLEDDLFVSPNFYYYVMRSLEFSYKEPKIGGVSLYNHQLNVHNNKNFQPIEDGYDNWYFQFASSWGQAWSKKQWREFRAWYDHKPSINENRNIPRYVRSWSEKSWLKYFIAFLVIKDRYFIYPKISLTSNFGDAGTHVGEDSTAYQVPLLYANKENYTFSFLNESAAVYDAFYENTTLAKVLQIPKEELCIDLYGYQPIPEQGVQRYMVTTQKLNYQVVKQFGCSLKPIDANIIQEIEGDDIFLYDLRAQGQSEIKKEDRYRRLVYNYKSMGLNDAWLILSKLLKEKVKRVIKRIPNPF